MTDKRDVYLKQLKELGIPTAIYYPQPLHLQAAVARLGYRKGGSPISEQMSERIFSIPMHPYLDLAQEDMIVDTVWTLHTAVDQG